MSRSEAFSSCTEHPAVFSVYQFFLALCCAMNPLKTRNHCKLGRAMLLLSQVTFETVQIMINRTQKSKRLALVFGT